MRKVMIDLLQLQKNRHPIGKNIVSSLGHIFCCDTFSAISLYLCCLNNIIDQSFIDDLFVTAVNCVKLSQVD